MSGESLRMFLDGPYNRIADVKMYLFFANISRTALMTLIILLWLSVLIRNFWCRYLCPYGALLGLLSAIAPVTVRRDASACVNCGACARACPNCVSVNTKKRMNSPECMSCYSCVHACPKPGALRVAARHGGRAVSTAAYAAILVTAFMLASFAAPALGLWHSATPPELYKRLYVMIHTIEHPAPGSPEAPQSMPHGHSFETPSGDVNMNSNGQFR
jgi:NAD-dependent dihydropyrimidine dehydrogenase PreA subunit